MLDRIAGARGWGGRRWAALLAGAFCVAFKGAADEVAGAKTHGESKCKDDAAEENAKCQFKDVAAHVKVIEDHGCREHEHEPFDAEREEPRVLELLIHGSDEDRTGQVAGHERTGDEQEGGADKLREVRQERTGQGCG